MQETKKKASKAVAKPKADKPKPEKKRAAPAAKKETKKAKKDPNAPKRGLSAFMYFSNAKRDEVHVCLLLLEQGLPIVNTCCCCFRKCRLLEKPILVESIIRRGCFTYFSQSAALKVWPVLSQPAGVCILRFCTNPAA